MYAGDTTLEHLLHYYGFVPSESQHIAVSVCERELWYSSKEVDAEEGYDGEAVLSLRMTLLSALIKGFKEDPSTSSPAVVPLKALRGASIITTRKQNGHSGHAGTGYPFKVGGNDIEDILMIYARTLVVTNDDYAKLRMSGLLNALASNRAACISLRHEHAALRLLDKVLTSQLHTMQSRSSLDDDALLLESLGSDKERLDTDMPNMSLCLRYRMQRKQILGRAKELVRNLMRHDIEKECMPAANESRDRVLQK